MYKINISEHEWFYATEKFMEDLDKAILKDESFRYNRIGGRKY